MIQYKIEKERNCIMNVILTAINAKYIHSNLAVYCLRAFAKPYLSNIHIAEYTINQQTDDILMDLYKQKPDVLCFSCYIWNIEYIEEIIKEIKKLFPRLPIWLGGPEVSYDAKDVLLRLPEVTGIMKGEGEETFLEVMDYYHQKREDLSCIKGITYRQQDEIIENPWRNVIDLSSVPFVYQHMEKFEHKIIYYESSRGCPFSCSYCLSSIDKCLRFRKLSLVFEELQFFIDSKVPQVKFVDRTFNCNHTHALAIWTYLKEHDNGITNFHFEVAADLLNEEELSLIETMRPGLIQLEIGVQSTNPDTIEEIHRKMDFDKVAAIVQRINHCGNIHQHLDLIAGLPYEDLESFQKSFDDVYRVSPEQLQLGFLKVLKGSYLERKKESYGLVYKSKPPYEVLYTKWISYEDVMVLKSIEEMVETYYNSRQFEYTMKQLEKIFSSPFLLYGKLGAFYEEKGYDKVSHSRIARYEILKEFIAFNVPKEQMKFFCELLTYDLYLRDNIKNRPAFAGEYTVGKEKLYDIYDNVIPTHPQLSEYAKGNRKNMRKMSHIEKFQYDVMGSGQQKETILLFDYQKRNPLNHQALVIPLI